jgi:hypothetical protein
MLPPPADDFEVELSRWGPESPSAPPSLADSRAYCRFLATGHYENFPVVSLLLPKPLHQHFYNVYAYCRWSDDLGDETGDPPRALALRARPDIRSSWRWPRRFGSLTFPGSP